ncbi:hypothetical protein JCM8547_006754 [Rhodosporidiobolus lusitaniae]
MQSLQIDTTSPESLNPQRKIFSAPDVERWLRSEAYERIDGFIQSLRSVSTKEELEGEPSQAVKIIVDFLKKCAEWFDEASASNSPSSRSKAFKAWLSRVEEASAVLNRDLVPSSQSSTAIPELTFHLSASFGSAARMDYGTGHELSFLAYLRILRLVGALTEEDEPAIVRRVFVAYRAVVEKLQRVFKLEAAGKMGVWGVDEHQHLVYHFGASQSRIHASNRPTSLLSSPTTSPSRISYLFLSSLFHLNSSSPPASFASTSHSIAPNDDDGLLKLYRSEVLHRLPVIQHFRFSAILRWVDARTGEPLSSTGDGLSEQEREALDATLDKRERDSGTVAPWALPSLSGEKTPEELLTRLPSPSLNPSSPLASSPTTPKNDSPTPSSPVTPASEGGSPVPKPYSAMAPHLLGHRRASRLSIAESADGAEENGGQEE